MFCLLNKKRKEVLVPTLVKFSKLKILIRHNPVEEMKYLLTSFANFCDVNILKHYLKK